MAGNIIPAIATTNAMTAGLCVLQAFKVMRNELDKAKMVFLTRGERVIASDFLRKPNPTCPACSVAQSTLVVDTSRATLKDLVDDLLRLQLGYGEEFSINSEAGMLYDPEEDQNLPKTFDELGLKADTSITVMDEADEDTKVNLVLIITEKSLDQDTKPIHLSEKLKIPAKPRPAVPAQEINGHTHSITNGVTNGKRKRTADGADLEEDLVRKRGKVAAAPEDKDITVIDDGDGAIIVED